MLQPSATLSDHNYWSVTKGCATDSTASAFVRLIQCEQQYRSAVSAVAFSLCVLIKPARTTAQLFVYEGLVSCGILPRSCSWLMLKWCLDHKTTHPLCEQSRVWVKKFNIAVSKSFKSTFSSIFFFVNSVHHIVYKHLLFMVRKVVGLGYKGEHLGG